jgi:hypothetical protein
MTWKVASANTLPGKFTRRPGTAQCLLGLQRRAIRVNYRGCGYAYKSSPEYLNAGRRICSVIRGM